jgi:type I restriction enzyme S subunit
MMAGWKSFRIGDWGEVKGGRQRSPHIKEGRMRPYLRVANVLDGTIDTTDVLEMPFTDQEFAAYAVRPGDILLNEGQSSKLVGRSAIYNGAPNKYAYQNTLIRFRPGPECDPAFAHELFRHLWRKGVFERISKKTTSIAHLGVSRFADLRVQAPTLSFQRRVGTILQHFDAVGRGLLSIIAAKREMKRGLMNELLTGGRRFPEFRGTKVPVVPLGDHAAERSERNTGGLGIERVMGVTKDAGLVQMRDNVRATDLSRYKVVRLHGFAYNPMRLNIGSIARSHSSDECLVSPDYVVFETDPRTLLPAYLDQLRRSQTWSRFVRQAGSGSVRVRIYFRDLSKMRIPLPAVSEQRCIANVLYAFDREISLLESLHEAYLTQKVGIMQGLLSGKLTFHELAAGPEFAHA